MDLFYDKGNYYVFDGKDNILIDREVFRVFDKAYGNDVNSYLKNLLFCNSLIRLRNLGYDIKITPSDKKVKILAFDKDGAKMDASMIKRAYGLVTNENVSKAVEESSKKMAVDSVNQAFERADDSSKVNDLSSNTKKPLVSSDLNDASLDFDMSRYNLKTVKSPKKLKTKGKIFRKLSKVFICILIAGTFVGVHSAYDNQVSEQHSRANENTLEYVNDHQASEDYYGVSPFEYEGNTKAYLKSDTLFASNGGILPVCQFEDNNYGLQHNVDGSDSKLGTIFKDFRNSEGLSDDFTFIYGHNIVGSNSVPDSMFGKVADYANTVNPSAANNAEENYKMAPSFEYYDEYGHYEMDIFASSVYDATDIINWTGNFSSEADFQTKMNTILADSDINNVVSADAMPEYGDKIVCLFTCPYFGPDKVNEANRVLVFAKAKQLEKYKDIEATSNYARL